VASWLPTVKCNLHPSCLLQAHHQTPGRSPSTQPQPPLAATLPSSSEHSSSRGQQALNTTFLSLALQVSQGSAQDVWSQSVRRTQGPGAPGHVWGHPSSRPAGGKRWWAASGEHHHRVKQPRALIKHHQQLPREIYSVRGTEGRSVPSVP